MAFLFFLSVLLLVHYGDFLSDCDDNDDDEHDDDDNDNEDNKDNH